MTQQEVWLRLSAVRRLDTAIASHVADIMANVTADNAHLLAECGMTAEQISTFHGVDPRQLRTSLCWLERDSHYLVPITDPRYPMMLKQTASAPLVLFVAGNLAALATPQLAMVGSRKYSEYGEQCATYFSAGLVKSGFTITSGLALGIDGICHEAALDCGGTTVAVLGSGLMRIHPRRHESLACRILEQGGALVSELEVSASAIPANFPRRNRIISGMSVGVLVVEASLRSGSLITARYALEQDREVFALPGPIDSNTSEGTHWLIKQGAYLVTEPNDIAEQIGSGLT